MLPLISIKIAIYAKVNLMRIFRSYKKKNRLIFLTVDIRSSIIGYNTLFKLNCLYCVINFFFTCFYKLRTKVLYKEKNRYSLGAVRLLRNTLRGSIMLTYVGGIIKLMQRK